MRPVHASSRHTAAAVTYPIHRPASVSVALVCVLLLQMVVLLAWGGHDAQLSWRHGLGWCTLMLAAGAAAWHWARLPSGGLAWNGASWVLTADADSREGSIQRALDGQSFLLLRWSAAQQRRWLWVTQASAPEHWQAFRRAVYSPAPCDVSAVSVASDPT